MRGTSLTRFERLLDAETYERFVERYTERLVETVGDRRPYYYPFKRILFWGRRPA
jgi:trans-aconitate 2-methyltransferase